MLKNLLDACGAGLAFYALGYGFAFGYDDDNDGAPTSTFIGNANFFLEDVNPAVFFFQYAFSATCVTIIAGTLAERCRMSAYFAYSLYMTGFVYPVVAHTICTFTSVMLSIRVVLTNFSFVAIETQVLFSIPDLNREFPGLLFHQQPQRRRRHWHD
jgi:ammonia channel protein AmtB